MGEIQASNLSARARVPITEVEGIMDGDGMKKLSDVSPASILHLVRNIQLSRIQQFQQPCLSDNGGA